MQTLGQLHNSLAYIIGDSIAPITADPIADGGRFSTVLRQSYLQRALDEVLSELIQQMVSLPSDIKSDIASRLFPTTLTTTTVQAFLVPNAVPSIFGGESTITGITALGLRAALFVSATYNASTSDSLVNGLIPRITKPIPIHDHIKANSLINSRSTQYPDMFFKSITMQTGGITSQWTNDLYLYDYQGEISDDGYISVSYIEYPPLLNTLAFDTIVKFEDMYMNQVLQKAAMYARIDSQEEDYQMQQQGQ
jgi:hypothetical protein